MKTEAITYFSKLLYAYRKARTLDKVKHLALDVIFINSLYFIFCLLIETLWYLSPELKTLLWYGLLLNGYFIFRFIGFISDLVLRHDKTEDEDLLLLIGNRYGNIKDKLLNHYQLSFMDNDISRFAVRQFMETYPETYFENSYQKKSISPKWKWALGAAIFLGIAAVISHAALFRLFHVRTSFDPPRNYSISVMPPDTSLYMYDSLNIRVEKQAPSHYPVEIYRYDTNTKNKDLLYRSRDSLINLSMGRQRQSAIFLAQLRRPNIFHPRKFIDTDTLRLTLLQRPSLLAMDMYVTSPGYASIPEARYQGNIDKISMLKGSTIIVALHLSEPLGTAVLVSGQDTLEMQIDHDRATVSWCPRTSNLFIIYLTNINGIGPENDPAYTLVLEEDYYPSLQILSPKLSDDIILNDNLSIPYAAQLQDDFGLSSFTVNYSSYSEYSYANDTSVTTLPLPFMPDSRLQTRIGTWEIHDFISPGSEIRYYFELSDNDTVSGPKTVRSALYYATLPSLGDLFERQNEKQDETMALLEDELVSTETIVEELDELQKELLREGEMSWENKTALEENLKTLENARKELQEMQSALDEQAAFMEENALFSDKVMQSFEQLQDLMNDLIDDDMFNMLQDIQEKLQRNETEDMEEILQDFSEKAKRFEESLDRMLEVFKRIQQEQRLEELGAKIKETLKEQTELLEEADDRSGSDLAEQQKKIASETREWESLSRESADLFEDADKDLYDEFLKKLNDMDMGPVMDEASRQYASENREKGKQNSSLSRQQLQDMEAAFKQMAQAIMKQQKEDITGAFQRAFHKTLFLSNEQEAALAEGKDLNDGSPLIHRYTTRMNNNLQTALSINDDLLALSKKTFLVDKAIGQSLGQVIGNLRSGLTNVEEARLSQGQTSFTTSFKSMNQLARILLERMSMAMDQQQGNASGLEFYMQQLQQMAGQQQQLNAGMPQPGVNGAPGSSMMDQLARMAARQQALRKKLKQIQQGMAEGNNGQRVTGNLDRIAKDMEEVINQMRQNHVDRQTIMRQEKIVQRLLDASRSATSRDYKKDRESKTGKDLLRDNPLSLPGDLGERESLINMIRREVQNSDLTPVEKREMERYLESLLGSGLETEGDK